MTATSELPQVREWHCTACGEDVSTFEYVEEGEEIEATCPYCFTEVLLIMENGELKLFRRDVW